MKLNVYVAYTATSWRKKLSLTCRNAEIFVKRNKEAFSVTCTQREREKKAAEDELESRDGEGAKSTRGGENGREERKQEDERASSISPTW